MALLSKTDALIYFSKLRMLRCIFA